MKNAMKDPYAYGNDPANFGGDRGARRALMLLGVLPGSTSSMLDDCGNEVAMPADAALSRECSSSRVTTAMAVNYVEATP